MAFLAFWPAFGLSVLLNNLSARKILEVKTVGMWWWWWLWRETINGNVVVVMVAGKRNVVVVVYSSTIHEAVLKKS